MRALEAYAAAKVNLGWRVGALRPDGYHAVCGLVQTISLSDVLEVRTHEREADVRGTAILDLDATRVGLTVTGEESAPDLATADNLVLRAATVLAEVAAPRPTSIVLRKSIPVAAGLGGGSADAAAALTALALSWEARIDAGRLVRLGAEVSSDVPPILVGGLVAVSGRGTDVRRIGSPEAWFVLGVSDVRLGAGEVYAALDALRPPPAGLVRPWLEHNDLEAAVCSLSPEVGRGLEALRAAGGGAVFVSGSGPTVVAACASEHEARTIAAGAEPTFRRTVVCRAGPWGVRLVMRRTP